MTSHLGVGHVFFICDVCHLLGFLSSCLLSIFKHRRCAWWYQSWPLLPFFVRSMLLCLLLLLFLLEINLRFAWK